MNAKVVTRRTEIIAEFIKDYAPRLHRDEKEDLTQEIFLTLLQDDPNLTQRKVRIIVIAKRVLEKHRGEQYEQFIPKHDPDTKIDHTAPDLEMRLTIQKALTSLPKELQGPAEDFFYRDMSQVSVAQKYHKSAAWASATKAKIQKLLSKSL